MIEDPAGRVDYAETGEGPAMVLVPGSCSTGAAWRQVMAALGGRFRFVTTSLLGYGGTAERRTASDPAISHEAEALEAVIRRAGGPVHLVGHSFGGLVSLVVALRGRVPLETLTIMEAPAIELLREAGEHDHYRAFGEMSQAYLAAFHDGEREAVSRMIDFYNGAGTFASWPQRVRDYLVETTPANILDWASAYGYTPSPAALGALRIPVLIVCGGATHPAMQRANALLSGHIKGSALVTIPGAAHFMISTHPADVAAAIADHVAPGVDLLHPRTEQ
jgi:pimeloyl-ACP methyl ester carboxylesterase